MDPVRLGAFVVGAPLGSGGTGTVFHAVHDPTGTPAAIKVVRVAEADGARSEPRPVRNNIEAEVRAVVALDHPHIVQVYDLGEVDAAAAAASRGQLVAGTPWYAMELAESSLRKQLRALEWPELLSILLDLLDALAHAHARGVLHLDLKPDNVLLGGRRPGAKLGDFGMGLVGPADPEEDFVRGTPQFMAPEQVRGRWEELGPWTDLYALGCLSWRCLTGHAPFAHPTSTEVLAAQVFADPGDFELGLDAPPGIEAWVRRLLNKDPEHRWRFAADAARALRVVAGLPAEPDPPDWRVAELEAAAEVAPWIGLGLAAVREPPVVGRTREREVLWEALRDALAGEVRLVVLRGPSGAGKSRLARWLGIRAHELGLALALEGGHDDEDGGLVGALRGLFPADPRSADAESELGARLMTRGLPVEAARDAASLLVHGADGPTPSSRPWGEVVGDVLRAAERPVIVVLDDAQWGAESLEWLLAMIRGDHPPPSVWVLAVDDQALVDRPAEHELLDAVLALPSARVLDLGPLSERASAALSRRMLALEPSVAAELARAAAGNPRTQIDLVHEWARRGRLAPGPEGYRLLGPPDLSPVSDPLGERIAALVEGRPDWQAALEVAAVLGPVFVSGEWQAACAEVGVDAPTGLLLELLRARFVRRQPGGRPDRWAFTPPMLRDVVEEWLGPRAREVHRVCARVVDPMDVERRGRHLLAAGEPDKAVPLLLRALARVVEVGRAGALLRLIDRGTPDTDARRAAIEDQRVSWLLGSGRPAEAHRAALRQLGVAGTEARAAFAAERNLARAALDLGDPQAADHARRAEVWAWDAQDPVLVRRAWVLASQVARSRRDLERAQAEVEWASLLVVPWREGLELQAETAAVAIAQERWAAAEAALAELEGSAGATRARLFEAAAALATGDLALARGEPARALDAYRTARRRYRALDHADEGLAQAGLAVALLAADREPEAEQILDRVAPDRVPRHVSPRVQLRRAVAEVVLRAGRPRDLGWAGLWREVRRRLESPLAGIDPALPAMLAAAAARSGRPERARELRSALAPRSV